MLWLLYATMVVITTTLAALACWRWRNRRFLKLAASVPGPPALPVLGNALLFMASPSDQLKLIGELINEYGHYLKFWMGPDLNIFVKNPEDIKLLLSSNNVKEKGPVYDSIGLVLGSGLFTGGKVWRNHRKIVTPSYNKQSVSDYERVFNVEAASLVQALSNKDPKQTFNVYWDVVNCTTQCVCLHEPLYNVVVVSHSKLNEVVKLTRPPTLQIYDDVCDSMYIKETLMGLSKFESQNLKHLDQVVRNTSGWYSTMFLMITKWYLHIPLVYWLTGTKKELDYSKTMCHNLSSEIIEKRLQLLAKSEGDDARCAVDRFLMSGELTMEEIKQETVTVFTTSQEASAKIASAVLVFLAHLPEWQDKVYNEIQECLDPNDDILTGSQLKRLQYLDMVYKEALRYMSIGPLIQRTVEQEITINSGRITLPVGTSVIIPLHFLHRDPQYWDDPNKVKSERFLPENVKRRNPNVFIPFSLGPMDCLGRVFATALIKTIVVRVLRHLRLEADGCLEDLDIEIAISVRFTAGYNLRVSPRQLNHTHTTTG